MSYAVTKTFSPPRNKEKNIPFICHADCMSGPYSLQEGEPMMVVPDGTGHYYVYVDWAEGAIGRLSAKGINRLAGCQIVNVGG